jgi:hypothetical protein
MDTAMVTSWADECLTTLGSASCRFDRAEAPVLVLRPDPARPAPTVRNDEVDVRPRPRSA